MSTAYTILRVALGLNIFMHGFVRLRGNMAQFCEALLKEFDDSILSRGIIKVFGTMLPVLETVVGLLLLFGLFTEYALVSGSLLMLILIFGKSLKADWQTVSLQMIYVAFYAALDFLKIYNTISLDKLFF
jgi:thiosulfate dehydrogenase [quinone] large subunit